MSQLTHGKVILYLAAIFVAGVIAGSAIGYAYARQNALQPPKTREMSERLMKRYQERLALTSAQAAQIRPLVEQASGQMQASHRESLQRVSDIFKRMNQQIAGHLTAGQRGKLEEVESERCENVRKKCGQRGNGDGGSREGRRGE
jgi:Spy/CpxP family protein refolding chaperone